MATPRIAPIGLVLLLPATALAHGPGGHPADPNLHVDPSLEECSVVFAPELTQPAYRRFLREFGSVSAFKRGAPPTSLGAWGVSAELEWIFFSIEDKSAAWNDTFAHPDAYHELGSSLSFPKLRLRVGVTDDLDVGAYYSKSPNANYGWLGLEAQYAILQQGDDMPIALAVRGAYTKTLYVADMDMHAISADVTVGRTFWKVLTPRFPRSPVSRRSCQPSSEMPRPRRAVPGAAATAPTMTTLSTALRDDPGGVGASGCPTRIRDPRRSTA
jgi:hypothetical protein